MSESFSLHRWSRLPLLVAFALVASLAGIATPQRSAPPAAAAVGDPGGFTVTASFAAGFPATVGVSSFVSCTRGGTSIGGGVFSGLAIGSETQTFTSIAGTGLQVGDVCTVTMSNLFGGALPEGVGASPASRTVTITGPASSTAATFSIFVPGFTVTASFAAGFPNSVGVPVTLACSRGGTSIGGGVFAGLAIGSETLTFTGIAGTAFLVGDVCTVTPTNNFGGALPEGVGTSPASRTVTITGPASSTAATFSIFVVAPTTTTSSTTTTSTTPPTTSTTSTTSTTTAPQLRLDVSDASVVEGDQGERSLVFTVRLSGPPAGSVQVTARTSNGTAAAGNDYRAVATALTFSGSTREQQVVVKVKGDRSVEPDETLSLDLSSPVGAVIGDGHGVGTIRNDDTPCLPTPRRR